jgi:DNA-binding NarL/FixJ family response regulator
MKVLLVENSELVRRMIKRFIRDQVDEFVECSDGSQALDAYTKQRPDLVLMDIKMNQMGGFEATREIKAAFPAARVFIVSQWDSPALREAARAAGAESYISKADLLPLRDLLKAGQKP